MYVYEITLSSAPSDIPKENMADAGGSLSCTYAEEEYNEIIFTDRTKASKLYRSKVYYNLYPFTTQTSRHSTAS